MVCVKTVEVFILDIPYYCLATGTDASALYLPLQLVLNPSVNHLSALAGACAIGKHNVKCHS